MSAVLKDVDTSPVVTAKVSTHAITLTRQPLNESSSAYLCFDRVISVIEVTMNEMTMKMTMKIFYLT